MNAEKLEKIVARQGMQCLELKKPFNAECVETAGALSLREGRILPVCAGWTSRRSGSVV